MAWPNESCYPARDIASFFFMKRVFPGQHVLEVCVCELDDVCDASEHDNDGYINKGSQTTLIIMTREFYSRLKNYYNNVGSVLRDQASISSIFPNTTDIGLSREGIYAEFLKSHLPNNCHVFLGGFLFNIEGAESKQIDLFVASDSSLQFNFADQGCQRKAFACIDGTLAVASLKSNLDSQNLNDALERISKNLFNRNIYILLIP